MESNGKWWLQGKDGKFYENENELVAADNRWNQQEKQNQLLAQQNNLIAQQNREKESLAREKMANDIAVEQSRQEHEKEMRLLSLCDNIGISKSIMDSYINYLNDEKLENHECKNEINELDEKIKKLDKEYHKVIHMENKKENTQEIKPNLSNEELIKIYEDIKNKNYKTYGKLGTMGTQEKKL